MPSRWKFLKLQYPEFFAGVTEKQIANRNCAYMQNYGISMHTYMQIVEAQNFRCPICQQPLTFRTGWVDHCHSDGTIRGVVHPKCNQYIANFENIEMYLYGENIANYLDGEDKWMVKLKN